MNGVSVGPLSFYAISNVFTNQSITATFAIDTYSISPAAGSHGTISPSATQTVSYGDTSAFSITPDPGYFIASITDNGRLLVPTSPVVFSSVSSSHALVATFASAYTVTALVAGGKGSVAVSNPNVEPGGATTITPTPSAGYHVVSITDNGISEGGGSPLVLGHVDASHLVAITFALDIFTISPLAGPNGTISPSSPQTASYGDFLAFRITPDPGYHIASVSVDGSPVGAGSSHTLGPVSSDADILATFAVNSYTLSYGASAGGLIVGSPSQTAEYESSGSAVTAVAYRGFHFVVWSDGVTAATRTDVSVTGDVSVTADFAPDPPVIYHLTYAAGVGGAISGAGSQTVASGQSGTPVSAVAGVGYHFVSWSDGLASAARTDSNVVADLDVSASFALDAGVPVTTLTISANPTSVRLPKAFVLSGALMGVPTNGLRVVVNVKKPGSGRWSYSSARLTYGALSASSSWWYRYTPKLRGTYSFYVGFAGDSTHLAAPDSATLKVTVK